MNQYASIHSMHMEVSTGHSDKRKTIKNSMYSQTTKESNDDRQRDFNQKLERHQQELTKAQQELDQAVQQLQQHEQHEQQHTAARADKEQHIQQLSHQ